MGSGWIVGAVWEGGFVIFRIFVYFVFLSIEIHSNFPISCKILSYFVYYYIFDQDAIGRRDIFFSARFAFFHTRLSSYLIRKFLYLISFLLFPCAGVRENTRA